MRDNSNLPNPEPVLANPEPKIDKSYDGIFVAVFVKSFTENFVHDALVFKKSLLIAPLKRSPTALSLIDDSIKLNYLTLGISEALRTNSNAILDIYLRNLEGIKTGFLKKIEEIGEIGEKEKLKTVIDEAFEILENVKNGKPQINLNLIVFDSAEKELKNVILLEDSGNYYLGSVKAKGSNIFHGEGTYAYIGGDVYEGDFKDGKKDGKGIYRYANGDVYEGEFKDEKIEGEGIYVTGDCVYEGDFKDDKIVKLIPKHGEGIYIDANGDVYEGNFKDGKKHGKGIYKDANGDVYEGNFKDGKKDGKGIYKDANGDVYEGNFKDGKKDGKYIYVTGDCIYEGDFKDDKIVKLIPKHGEGTYKYANGDVYMGKFKDGKRDGEGIFSYATNGNFYNGYFKDGKKHGKGMYGYGDRVYEGDFEDEKIVKGTLKFRDGHVYEGSFKDGEMDGKGIYKYANGDSYDGDFKGGKIIDGKGIYKYAIGVEEKGNFKDGKMTGSGVRIFTDGTIYNGCFEDGKMAGEGTLKFTDKSNGNESCYKGSFKDGKGEVYLSSSPETSSIPTHTSYFRKGKIILEKKKLTPDNQIKPNSDKSTQLNSSDKTHTIS